MAAEHPLLARLGGGDRRSTGEANAVAQMLIDQPELAGVVFEGMFHSDARVRMRAADALEKASARNPTLIAPFASRLIHQAAASTQQEVQWHIAQMLARLDLTPEERDAAVSVLMRYLRESDSNIVIVSALSALAEFAKADISLRDTVIVLIEQAMARGTPSIMSRGKKLLKRLRR
ncbi:hypothetical protein QPK87_20500 [Kamptonema cortianum]|jgi:hypothetical protein|nr:hypothetical protein [Kamptonema cortianum]